VLVTCGDTPLLTGETLASLAAEHADAGNAVTVLTAEVPDPDTRTGQPRAAGRRPGDRAPAGRGTSRRPG
ncbi:hypothetical protein, partial [Streptomyces alkaliphilus]|uniref:hypothetical protein n=1 Tax=Streptomyces alkaliphilus TaxID=1472722 RepID=UPI001191ABAD